MATTRTIGGPRPASATRRYHVVWLGVDREAPRQCGTGVDVDVNARRSSEAGQAAELLIDLSRHASECSHSARRASRALRGPI
jgi:hypothetical protein